MRRIFLSGLIILLAFTLILGGCTEPTPTSTPTQTPTTTPTQTPTTTPTQTPTTTPTETPTPSWEWPDTMLIKTHGSASPTYAEMVAWSAYLEKTTGTKVRLGPEEIAAQRSRPVRTGEALMCVGGTGDFTYELEGIETYATRDGGPWPMRVFWLTSVTTMAIMVRADSPIETYDDITADTRWACWAGPAPRSDVIAAAAWAGIPEEDVNIIIFADPIFGTKAVMEGKADAACWVPSSSISFELEGTPPGIRWIGYDAEKNPEGAARYLEIRPKCYFGMPSQEKQVESAKGIPMVMSPGLICAAESADTELIYQLAKWTDENFEDYKDLDPRLPEMELSSFRKYVDNMILPLHDGVIKYLKEKGMWTADDEAKQEYLVDLISKYRDAYEAAIADADAKGIEVDPENEAWLELWASFKQDLPRFKALIEVP